MSEKNYIDDRTLIGGMISSKGFLQQDLTAVKYLFEYLDKGLEFISCEGYEDFVLHFSDDRIMKFQSKRELLTVNYVREQMKKYKDEGQLCIVGSGMDDKFRIFNDKYLRYKEALKQRIDT